MSRLRRVLTPQGEAELVIHRARRPEATLVLTHGAGGDVDARDLTALAARLPSQGVSVILVRMPWRVAGKKLAPRPALIDEAYAAVLRALRLRTPLILGGRSAGARSACRIASAHGAVGVLALSFPLHPPGRPEKSRLEELSGTRLRTLVVQGQRDPFGGPDEFPQESIDAIDAEIVAVPFADHSFKVPKRADISADEVVELIVEAVLEWIVGLPEAPETPEAPEAS